MNNDWMHIPGFNGYMINSDGFVLSFKNYRKFPNGRFMKSNNGHYVLTNNDNESKSIHYTKLLELCRTKNAKPAGTGTYMGGRNLIRPARNGKLPLSQVFKPTQMSDILLEE